MPAQRFINHPLMTAGLCRGKETAVTYREASELLEKAGIEDPCFEAGLLAERFSGVKRHELLWDRDRELPGRRFAGAVMRRASREPIQYILGSWAFYGREFCLNRDCLIPRPDTETVAGEAVRRLPRGALFCDIGTGCGTLAVTVLCERPDCSAVATDISLPALRAARMNARALGVKDRSVFRLCDVFCDTACLRASPACGFDAVISNPPYIPSGEIGSLAPELSFEPRAALDGGRDGLDFYRRILSLCFGEGACGKPFLRPGGLLIFEAGAGEAEAIASEAGRFGAESETAKDLAGIDRAVILYRAGSAAGS